MIDSTFFAGGFTLSSACLITRSVSRRESQGHMIQQRRLYEELRNTGICTWASQGDQARSVVRILGVDHIFDTSPKIHASVRDRKLRRHATLLRQETNVITFKQGQQSRCGLHQHPKQYKCSAGKHRRESKILYRDQLCPKGRLLPKANIPPVSSSSEAAPARQVSSSSSDTGPRLNEAGGILTSFPPT